MAYNVPDIKEESNNNTKNGSCLFGNKMLLSIKTLLDAPLECCYSTHLFDTSSTSMARNELVFACPYSSLISIVMRLPAIVLISRVQWKVYDFFQSNLTLICLTAWLW